VILEAVFAIVHQRLSMNPHLRHVMSSAIKLIVLILQCSMLWFLLVDRVAAGGGFMEAKILPDSVSELQQKVARAEEVKRISNQIHAAKDLD
jgi:hypothetical protein